VPVFRIILSCWTSCDVVPCATGSLAAAGVSDGGIDGRAYFKVGKKDNAKIIFQVKSGGVGRGDRGTAL